MSDKLANIKLTKEQHFRGKPTLKAAGVELELTEEQVREIELCAVDPIYFMNKYVRIRNVDDGLIPFKTYPYQNRFVEAIHNNRYVSAKFGRQMGKTTTVASYLCHYAIFNEMKYVGIIANKEKVAKEILARVKQTYESLPTWLQLGVVSWNKESIELENGSMVLASSTSADSIRGYSLSILYVDEVAHIHPKLWDEFITSTFPVICSGKTTKVIYTSTPKGLNHFYQIHTKAEKGLSDFVAVNAIWSDHPERDEAWKEEMIRNTSLEQFRQEHECEFVGSSNTLLSVTYLRKMKPRQRHVKKTDRLFMAWPPADGHIYFISVDVSRGIGADYNAFVVIDITDMNNMKEVCYFRDNTILYNSFAEIVDKYSTYYNNAMVLVEINDMGQALADVLHYDLECENVLIHKNRTSTKSTLGMRTTATTKKIGCATLKTYIENKRLTVTGKDILGEFLTFVADGKGSYSAEYGEHDDLVMCLVNFAYYSTTIYFEEIYQFKSQDILAGSGLKQIEEDLPPIPIINDGLDEIEGRGKIVDDEEEERLMAGFHS